MIIFYKPSLQLSLKLNQVNHSLIREEEVFLHSYGR